MKRLFIAIPLPERIRDDIADTYHAIPGTRWVEEMNLHITLRFCGESSPQQEESLVQALRAVSFRPFSIICKGVGQFPAAKEARVLWAGVEAPDEFMLMQQNVEKACVKAGLAAEGKKFSPHITVARCKSAPPDRVARFIVANSLFKTETFEVAGYSLYSSHLGKSGTVYTEEARFTSA